MQNVNQLLQLQPLFITVTVTLGIIIFSFIFKKPFSMFFEKMTNFKLKNKTAKSETEIEIESSDSKSGKEGNLAIQENTTELITKTEDTKQTNPRYDFFLAFQKKLSDKAHEIYIEALKAETNEDKRFELKLSYATDIFNFGFDNDMIFYKDLLDQVKDHEKIAKIEYFISNSYYYIKNFEKSIEFSSKAMCLTSSEGLKTNCIIRLSESYYSLKI